MDTKERLGWIAGVLTLATLSIGANFLTQAELSRPAEFSEDVRRQMEKDRAANVEMQRRLSSEQHEAGLLAMQDVSAPRLTSRCNGSNRVELRSAIRLYVDNRAIAVELSRQPEFRDLDRLWRSAEDDHALADARNFVEHGYLLPSDFGDWPERNNVVMRLPARVVSQCGDTIDQALKQEHEQQNQAASAFVRPTRSKICGSLVAVENGFAATNCR